MDWETIKAWVEQYGYLAVGLGTLIDQSGLQSFVVAGGVLAGVESRISLLGVILAGAAGSFTSDAILFSIGRWRAGWIERIVKSEKGRMRLEVMQIGMHRWAIPMIAFGRFLPWIGRFMPAAAGLRRVGAGRVLTGAVLGALISSAAFAYLGFLAAATVRWVEEYAIFIWIGALVVSIPIARYMLRRLDRVVEARLAEKHEREAQPRDLAA
jgi:membrane protein DedA with SNARE-associated domain